jgi:hypothetical protein
MAYKNGSVIGNGNGGVAACIIEITASAYQHVASAAASEIMA